MNPFQSLVASPWSAFSSVRSAVLRRSAAGLVGALLFGPVVAQAPILLRDINARPLGTVNLGSDFEPLGTLPTSPPTLLFSAWTEASGRELWATDGTAAGTRMLADWNPGLASSDPSRAAVLPDGSALLAMDHPSAGREIHRVAVNGPSANDTVTLVEDATTGAQGNRYPRLFGGDVAVLLATCIRKSLSARRERAELVKSDGQTVEPVATFGDAPPREDCEVVQFGNLTCIAVDDGVHGCELWRSDLTAAGTVLVNDVLPGPGGCDPSGLTVVGDTLYCSGTFPGAGRELLSYDGNDVQVAADINPQGDSNPRHLTKWVQQLVFAANDGFSGVELYTINSDGTTSGFDLNPGPLGSDPHNFAVIGQTLWFSATDATNGTELWKLVASGTPTLAQDFESGAGDSDPGVVVAAGGNLYVPATVGGDRQLRTSTDGGASWSAVTTVRAGQGGARPRALTALGGKLLFAGDDDTVQDEVFVYDPLTMTVQRLADVNPSRTATRSSGAGASGFAYCNGLTYFAADDGVNGHELWVSDGTAPGTRQVADLNPGATASSIRDMVTINSTTLAMSANDVLSTGQELFKFDTNTAAFELIKDIRPGTAGSTPSNVAGPFFVLGNARDVVLFSASDGTNGLEPWVSDGTEAGTFMLGDLRPGFSGSGPDHWISAGNGLVLFAANDGTHGEELWATDGTVAGTRLVTDLRPGSSRGCYLGDQAARLGNEVYFGGEGPQNTYGLYRSNGVTTSLAVPSVRQHPLAIPTQTMAFAGRIYFTMNDLVHGEELWETDGAGGAVMVADLRPGAEGSQLNSFTIAGDRLFFLANTGSDWFLFATDGIALTQLDIDNEASFGGAPQFLRAFGDVVYFDGGSTTSASGRELWVSDGTPAGTRPTPEIRRGPQGAEIRDISVAGGEVWVSADDGVHGVEAYIVQATLPAVEVYGTSCGAASPTLSATTPTLGQLLELAVDSPGEYLGFVLLGVPPTGPRVQLGPCPIQLDLSWTFVAAAFVTGEGGATTTQVRVPDDPRLIEALLAAWGVFLPTRAGQAIQSTNGVLLKLGR